MYFAFLVIVEIAGRLAPPLDSALRGKGIVAVAVGFPEAAVSPLDAQLRLLVPRDATTVVDRFTLRIKHAGRALVALTANGPFVATSDNVLVLTT